MAEWFYTQQGQQLGPVSQQQLQQMAQAGQLQPTDMIWKDGMANWTAASSVRGLFGAVSADAPPAAPRLPSRQDPYADDRQPRGRPVRGRGDDDWDDEERPRRPMQKKGMSAGLLWGLIGGGVGLVAVIVLIAVLVGGNSGNERSFSLGVGRAKEFRVEFEKGKHVEITVKSKGKSDVDLFVLDNNKRRVAWDDSVSNNCRVRFTPSKTQTYTVRVVNLKRLDRPDINEHNSGTVKWVVTNRDDKKQVAAKDDGNKDGVNPNPLVPAGVRRPPFTVAGELRVTSPTLATKFGPKYYQMYSVSFEANRTYTIGMISNTFDNYLILKNSNNQTLVENDDKPNAPGVNAEIVYRPFQSGTYHIYATSLSSGRKGRFTLSVR